MADSIGQVSCVVDRYPQRAGHFSFYGTSDHRTLKGAFPSELVLELFLLQPSLDLPASSGCLIFASINKGRRSKCGAGRLSSESLRVVLQFPLEARTRANLYVSVYTQLDKCDVATTNTHTRVYTRVVQWHVRWNEETGVGVRWIRRKRGLRRADGKGRRLTGIGVELQVDFVFHETRILLTSRDFIFVCTYVHSRYGSFKGGGEKKSRSCSPSVDLQVIQDLNTPWELHGWNTTIGGVPGVHWTFRTMYLPGSAWRIDDYLDRSFAVNAEKRWKNSSNISFAMSYQRH